MSVSTLFFISTRTYPSIVLPIVSILIPLQIQTYIGDSSRGRTKSQPGFTGSLRGHQWFFICPPTEIPPGNLPHYYMTFDQLICPLPSGCVIWRQVDGSKIFVWPQSHYVKQITLTSVLDTPCKTRWVCSNQPYKIIWPILFFGTSALSTLKRINIIP